MPDQNNLPSPGASSASENPHHNSNHRHRHHGHRPQGNESTQKPAAPAEQTASSSNEGKNAPAGRNDRRPRRDRDRRHGNRERENQPAENNVPAEPEISTPIPDDSPKTFATTDSNFGFVTEAQAEPEVIYDETGAPAPVDFDYIPGKSIVPELTEEEKAERTLVVGVKFRNSDHSYYFAPGNLKLGVGTAVIVDTARGLEYGTVSFTNRYVRNTEVQQPLREIIRIATQADDAQNVANLELEEQAFIICKQQIAKHGLDMKLIEAQYTFDNAKLLFYFSSDNRVDFRDLVKDLASAFHTRIELRQIGIRDESRILGGLGACGRKLCCAGFITDFPQVSIKMAKEQNLSLNTSKISGCCGRLLCCLHYEHETYEAEIAKTPAQESVVQTPDGIGIITATSPLIGMVRVMLKNEKGEVTQKPFSRDDVTVLPKDALPEYFNRRPSDDSDKEKSDEAVAPSAPANTESNQETKRESRRPARDDSSRGDSSKGEGRRERRPRRERTDNLTEPKPAEPQTDAVAGKMELPKAPAPQGTPVKSPHPAPQVPVENGSDSVKPGVLNNIHVSFPKARPKNNAPKPQPSEAQQSDAPKTAAAQNSQDRSGTETANAQTSPEVQASSDIPFAAATPIPGEHTSDAPLDGVVRPNFARHSRHHSGRPFNPNHK